MIQQFFFMFSSGEYSDYRAGSICVCDHAVTKEEWDTHYRKYQDAVRARREKLGESLYDEPHWTRHQRWEKRNDPETTFQKLHGMKRIEVAEFWRNA